MLCCSFHALSLSNALQHRRKESSAEAGSPAAAPIDSFADAGLASFSPTPATLRKNTFYESEPYPEGLQAIEIGHVKKYSRAEESHVQQFLAWKVYWMGFKRGDKRTRVWIADPWDANYLGVTPQDLVRAAQTLEAHELIALVSKDADFASSSDALLRAATPQESRRPPRRIGFEVPGEKQQTS